MASDYGDEAGGKLLDWMLRIGQEAGAEAMARSARELSERLAGIRGTIAGGRAEAIAADGVPAYAKLSLEELSGLPEYATIKEVVSDKLRAASVEHHIIPGEGRDWLLFKVEDAPEVDEAFRQLEQETGKAADRARGRLAEIAEMGGARVWRVATDAELSGCDFTGIGTLGVTSGASTPEAFLERIRGELSRRFAALSLNVAVGF